MRPRLSLSSRRRRKSGGNSLVEGAFTILPTFALIIGFVDFGLMFFRWETLQNAVREGVRYAVTFQTSKDENNQPMGQAASIKQVVQKHAMGLVKASDPNTIFVNYYTKEAPTTPVSSGGNVPGNIVEVRIESPMYSWILPLSGSYSAQSGSAYRYSTPLQFKVSAYDILGGLPVGTTGVAE